jgi:hypothetical protein
MTIFFTGILHLFLLRRRRVGIDVSASLTMILVKKCRPSFDSRHLS